MLFVDQLILIGGILLLFATASSTFSSRIGVPVLVIFITVGMLAGSEGIGRIAFENYPLAHGIGTLALAVILFDGGLRTSLASIRRVAVPALSLATAGVLITSGLVGVAASLLLGLPPLEGFLLGSIVGSTDAAAVFSVLRGRSVHVSRRVSAVLELESGSNDPMAIFLTIGVLQVLVGTSEPGLSLLGLFVRQMGIGTVIGYGTGRLGQAVTNRLRLDAAGLYPVLACSFGLLASGAAAALGGSGFLSVYIAGIVLGNGPLVFKRGILLFFDGVAWLAQIVMFTVLGLLSFPSRLVDEAVPGLLIAAALVFIARPVATGIVLLPFRFSLREIVFIAWGGLKGAVPIVLATFPLIAGLASGPLIFDVVFFVVLVSASLQGWTLAPLARKLGLQTETEPDPPVTLDITSLRSVDADIVSYAVTARARAAGKLVRELALPDGAVIAMIARGEDILSPRGTTRIEAGDHVFVVLRASVRRLVDRVFSGSRVDREAQLPAVEFPLLAEATAGEIAEFYGIELPGPPERTLGALLRDELGENAVPGAQLKVAGVVLRVLAVRNGHIEQVGLGVTELNGEGAENSVS